MSMRKRVMATVAKFECAGLDLTGATRAELEALARESAPDQTQEERDETARERVRVLKASIRDHLARGADPEEQAARMESGREFKRSLLHKKRAALQAIAEAPLSAAQRARELAEVNALLPEIALRDAPDASEEPEADERPEPAPVQVTVADILSAESEGLARRRARFSMCA